METREITKSFFKKDTEVVAKNLLWKIIQVWDKTWIIFEVEAYKWLCDEASHAYPKKTPRNTLMYETFWKVYVYLIYWMHYCLNFTTDSEKPWAVLIRGVKDLETWKIYDWPWKLTKFFWIDKNFNWEDLENSKKIKIFDNKIKPQKVFSSSRIWIKKALDKKWRYYCEV
jgi:DNA-3-methyladenine glycosylase